MEPKTVTANENNMEKMLGNLGPSAEPDTSDEKETNLNESSEQPRKVEYFTE